MAEQPPSEGVGPQIEELRNEVRDLSERVVRIEERINTHREQVGRQRAESTVDNITLPIRPWPTPYRSHL